jgi:predicted ester cyclase
MITEQQLREILERWVTSLGAKDWRAFDELMDEVVASDCVSHLPGVRAPVRGPEGLKQYFRRVVESNPGYYATVEEVVSTGDKAASRCTGRRTDPATGKAQRITIIRISHFKDGKICEDWQLISPWEDEA